MFYLELTSLREYALGKSAKISSTASEDIPRQNGQTKMVESLCNQVNWIQISLNYWKGFTASTKIANPRRVQRKMSETYKTSLSCPAYKCNDAESWIKYLLTQFLIGILRLLCYKASYPVLINKPTFTFRTWIRWSVLSKTLLWVWKLQTWTWRNSLGWFIKRIT